MASALGSAGAPSTQSWLAAGPRTRGKTTEPSGGLEFSLLLKGEKEMGISTPGSGGGMQAAPAGTRWDGRGVLESPVVLFSAGNSNAGWQGGGMRGGRALGRGAAGKGLT